ncbi:hypothetical protein [Paraburkholderia sp. JPY419]|uniref:hypothetical protein n=1 Tax=Paraburkholderia sp. JPY419 TaxID=667660 RepID=UPI003D1AC1CA
MSALDKQRFTRRDGLFPDRNQPSIRSLLIARRFATDLVVGDCFGSDAAWPASSCYVTVQRFGNFMSSALLVPMPIGSTVCMAHGMAASQSFGLVMFCVARRHGESG